MYSHICHIWPYLILQFIPRCLINFLWPYFYWLQTKAAICFSAAALIEKCDWKKAALDLFCAVFNHHGGKISVIWLAERSAINTFLGKNKLWGLAKFQFYIALVALFEIRFRCLFFDVEKRRQRSEVKAIPWDLL